MTFNNSSEVVLGGDLGFVQTKASADNWQTKFASIVKPRSEVAVTGLVDAEGFNVGYKDQVFNVGSKGSYDFTADRLTRETDIARLLAIFGQYHEASGNTVVDLFVTGLPVYEYNDYKVPFQESLTKLFQYTFNERKHMMNVLDTSVIPQSAGAFYDFALNDDGIPLDTSIVSETVLTFDIGGRTSDGCIMEAARYSQDSFTVFQGVWKAQNELRRLIMKDFRYNMKPHEVDIVMRTGKLHLGSEVHDVHTQVYTAVATVYPEMRDELTLFIPDFRRFASVLLVGGGAYVFKDFLEEDIKGKCPVIVHENAEYANANGYRKFGKLRLNNR